MKLVYVAGPFSAPTREGVEANIYRAAMWGVEVAKLGAMPVVPHSNTSEPVYERIQPYEFWIEGTMKLMRRCDAVLMIEDWEKSSGARAERTEAERLSIPVFYSLDALKAWLEVYSGAA